MSLDSAPPSSVMALSRVLIVSVKAPGLVEEMVEWASPEKIFTRIHKSTATIGDVFPGYSWSTGRQVTGRLWCISCLSRLAADRALSSRAGIGPQESNGFCGASSAASRCLDRDKGSCPRKGKRCSSK